MRIFLSGINGDFVMLYKTLAQHFIDEIRSEKRITGSRLPALRAVVKQHQVSMTTATKAYDYLQETGWIFAKPQSGYFVKSILDNRKCSFPSLSESQSEARNPQKFAPNHGYNHTPEFFSAFGTAMLAPSLTPSIAFQRCIKRVTNRAINGLFHYPENRGNIQLRNALSQHFKEDSFAFSAEDLVITHGCLDAVKLAIETTTKQGDTIAINSPCYSGLLDLLTGLSRNIIEVPCNDNQLDIRFLETLMANKDINAALFSTSHINPTGVSFTNTQKKQLAELAEKYQIAIIEDDVYLELSHQKHTPLPVKTWDKAGYVLWCGSFSKTLAPGLRLGWCLPGRFIQTYMKQQSLTDSGVNGLIQTALTEFINTGDYRSHIHSLRITLHHQIHQYRDFLIKQLPSSATISQPTGGLVLWVHIPNLNTKKLEILADNSQIDIRCGARFSTHDTYKHCFRINCGWPLDTYPLDNYPLDNYPLDNYPLDNYPLDTVDQEKNTLSSLAKLCNIIGEITDIRA